MEEAPEFITVPADPQFHKSVSRPSSCLQEMVTHGNYFKLFNSFLVKAAGLRWVQASWVVASTTPLSKVPCPLNQFVPHFLVVESEGRCNLKQLEHSPVLCFKSLYRRSSSNVSGFNSEMCPDDQSVGFVLAS